jgi:ankyrin repeat protein
VIDDEEWNAMMWGALSGQLEIVEMLIQDAHLPVDHLNSRGETALMKAAANGHWHVGRRRD